MSTEHRRTPHSPEPLTVEEKKQFILSALPKMAKHTFASICSIVGIHDATTGRHIGSGLRCNLRGRRAILTAWHVIEQARQESGGLAIATGYGQTPYIVHRNMHLDSVADLAVYFVPADYPSSENIAFWPTQRMEGQLGTLSADYLFLHGFPGSQSYSSQILQGVVSRSLPYGAMQRLENLPDDLEPFQFAIEYDPVGMADATGVQQDLVDPRGLSGSPVWRIGVSGRSARHWSPDDSLLVGVLTQWRPDERVLVATSLSQLPSEWLEPS